MAIKILEAESDYVKIGNTVLPKNMFGNDYDGMSYDTIAKNTKAKYDNEKQAEADAKRKAELQAQAQEKVDEINSLVGGDIDLVDAMFKVLVPNSGKADSVAGELVRAINRIGYRYFNDGDYFFCGYGLETCGSCATYISETIDFWDDFHRVAEYSKTDYDVNDREYEKEINSVIEKVGEYILNHTELIATSNDEDCLTYPVGEWEYYDSFEWDCQLPENVQYHLDNGDISQSDIYEQITWDYNFKHRVDIYVDSGGYIQFEDLTYSDMQEMADGNLYNLLESWGQDLDDEYGSEYDDDDDYDEDD